MVKNIFVIFFIVFFNSALREDKINVFDPKTMGWQWPKIGIFSRKKSLVIIAEKKELGKWLVALYYTISPIVEYFVSVVATSRV
ncbi:MAG: hypothetical protein J6Q07_04875 [Alistipes sp.]|nr:hypothetical protein [Alistipes sp.]